VLTASRGTEYSFEGDPVPGATQPGSVFTHALVSGIRNGAADADGDGYISVDDAYAFAFTHVRETGAQQTPQRWLYGAEGDIMLARTPAARRATGSEQGQPVKQPPVTVAAPDTGSLNESGPRRHLTRKRLGYTAAVVAVVGVAVTAILLATAHQDPTPPTDQPSTEPSPGEVSTGPNRIIKATAPWRISVNDDTSAAEDGCQVILTNTQTGGRQSWSQLYGVRTFQIHDSGTFRWKANHPGCQVLPLPGAGSTPLPLLVPTGAGDTAAFEAKGRVQVTITDFEGSPTCELTLNALDDGRPLSFREVRPAHATVVLDTLGERLVYLQDLICGVRVTNAT
jgi:hypothetical protein